MAPELLEYLKGIDKKKGHLKYVGYRPEYFKSPLWSDVYILIFLF